MDLLRARREGNLPACQQFPHLLVVAGDVTKVRRVFQRERKRLERLIETNHAKRAWNTLRLAENSQNVCRCSQAHIPKHEFTSVPFEPFQQAKLSNIKSLSFGHWPNDRMEGLAISKRVHTMNPSGEL